MIILNLDNKLMGTQKQIKIVNIMQTGQKECYLLQNCFMQFVPKNLLSVQIISWEF